MEICIFNFLLCSSQIYDEERFPNAFSITNFIVMLRTKSLMLFQCKQNTNKYPRKMEKLRKEIVVVFINKLRSRCFESRKILFYSRN